jgi:putative ABC transport system permease protein
VILLRLISWQYVRKHRLRTLFTIAAVVLGAGTFVGMHSAGVAVLAAFNETVDRIAGKAQLQVTAGDSGFPEEVLDRVQSVPGVAVAVPLMEAVVQSTRKGEGNLLVLGVDMTGDRSIREYDLDSGEDEIVDDPLVFLAQPDSLIVSGDFARRNGLSVDSKITMDTMEGEKHFVVRGIMRSAGLGSVFGGNLAIMDLYAAQKVFGRGRRFDRIEVRLTDGLSLEQGEVALRQALGPGFQVDVPATRGHQFESLMQVYSVTVNIFSLFALFTGLFIIYNAFAIAVTQRRAEIGILRALGATRRQILALFLGEGVIIGLVGSALGILFGMFLARSTSGYVSDIMQALYGMGARAHDVTLNRGFIIAAMILGTATSIIGAILPARNAARVDPVKALQRGQYQVLSAGENRSRRVVAALFGLLAIVCAVLGRFHALFYIGYLSFITAALLLAPTLSVWLSRMLRPLLGKVRPVEGVLAADSLIQAPRRTSATVAALMLSLGLIVSIGGISRSSYNSIAQWIDTAFNPDLFVSASQNLVEHSFRFPDSMTPILSSVDGVQDVGRMRGNKISVNGASVVLYALDIEKVAARTRERSIVGGDFDQMHRLTAEGKGAIISENYQLLQHAGMGDILDIPSPFGFVRLPVVGIVRDYTNQSGTIFIDYSVYMRYWKDPSVDIYEVYAKPGTSVEDLKTRIQAQFPEQRRMFVYLNREVKNRVLSNSDQFLGLTYIQIFIALLVAVLGVANNLSISITDRRREFGVLRAVGALGMQVRRSVWLEAVTIALVGIVLGAAFGSLDLFYELELVRHDYAGLTLDYEFPFRILLTLIPVILIAAWAASIAPSESAARSSLREALEYE